MTDSPIETYLDELVVAMAGSRPRQLRHIVTEAEAHLRDAAEAGEARGLSALQTESEAVARFGAARDVARSEKSLASASSLPRQIVGSALLLGAIGALAIGVSGVLAAVVRAVGGNYALVDVNPGQVLPAARCAQWLALDPGAASCRDAAVSDWAAETVFYPIALGLLGAVALALFYWLSQRAPRRFEVATLPRVVMDAIAVTAFAAAAAVTVGLAVDAIVVSSGANLGQYLTQAPVALVAALVFGLRLVRDLRAPVVIPAD